MPDNENPTPRNGVQAAHLSLDVLEAIAESSAGLGVSELAMRLGFTKSSVFRHLQTLQERGYLTQDGNSARYMLGPRAAALGAMATRDGELLAAAQAPMRQLRSDVGQTVTLVAVGRHSIRVVDRLIGFDVLEIGIRPGSTLPLHATSHGKVAMAFSRQGLAELVRAQPLERLTPFTVCEWPQLQAQIELARQQGWSSSPQEIVLGINAVSAPIFERSGDCIGALAIVGSIQFVPPHPTARQLQALLAAAGRISRELGYMPARRQG